MPKPASSSPTFLYYFEQLIDNSSLRQLSSEVRTFNFQLCTTLQKNTSLTVATVHIAWINGPRVEAGSLRRSELLDGQWERRHGQLSLLLLQASSGVLSLIRRQGKLRQRLSQHEPANDSIAFLSPLPESSLLGIPHPHEFDASGCTRLRSY